MDIIKYVNTHPLIFIIIIIILLLILYKTYTLCACESFTTVPGLPISSDQPVNIAPVYNENNTKNQLCTQLIKNNNMIDPTVRTMQLSDLANNELIGAEKPLLIRFKCVEGEQVYYLSIIPFNNCEEYDKNNKKNDCTTNILILINENTVNTATREYTDIMNVDQKVCNYRKTLIDTSNGFRSTRPSSEIMNMEELSGLNMSNTFNNLAPSGILPTFRDDIIINKNACYNDYPECNLFRQYSTDFIISKHTDVNGVSKYQISGVTGGLNSNKNSYQIFINKDPMSNNVCADMNNVTTKYTQIDLLTTQIPNEGGIIGISTSTLRSKIRFKVTEMVDNIIVTNIGYVGKCNNSMACTTDGVKYPRLCLLNDILDPRVIEFEPVVKFY